MSDTAATDAAPTPDAPQAPKPTPAEKIRERRAARAQEQQHRMSTEQKPAPAAPAQPTNQPTLPGVQPQQPTAIVPPEILAELSALRAEKDARAKADEETKGVLAKLQEQVQMTEKQRAEIVEQNRALKITIAVRLAAMEQALPDAVEEVTELLAKRFTIDETGNVVAADETKAKVADVVKTYLEKKPFLAGKRVASGSGASPFPAQSAPATAPIKLDPSDPASLTAYARGLTFSQPPAQPRTPAK